MTQTASALEATLNIITSARLTPTEHLLLQGLLREAVDPEYTAQYVLRRINEDSSRDIEEVLQDLKRDWKRLVTKFSKKDRVPQEAQDLVKRRDGPHCCMIAARNDLNNKATTHVEPAWIIPPEIFDDREMDSQGPLRSLLEAFLTPNKVFQLQNVLRNEDKTYILKNLWLLSPSIHSAFRNGHIQILPFGGWTDKSECENESANDADYYAGTLWPEECSGLVLSNGAPFNGTLHTFTIHTFDSASHCLPSPFLFRIHYRIATALHLFFVEDRIAEGWPPTPLFSLSKTAQKMLRRCWHSVPKFMRVWCYRVLLRIGKYLYPPPISELVYQLPFGLYLKTCARSQSNEANALQLIEQYTSVPGPLWVDSYEENESTVLIMTRLKGQMLNRVFHRLSYQEREQFSQDLKAVVGQLRHIPNSTPYRFANTLGGPLVDHRLPDGKGGPFNQESDFNNYIVHKYVWTETREAISPIHSKQHRSFFTHADLHPTNILIDGGRLSGIVDWECAGFFPEYWEFTKGIFGVEDDEPMEKIIRDAFDEENYEDELKAEKLLWIDTPLGL